MKMFRYFFGFVIIMFGLGHTARAQVCGRIVDVEQNPVIGVN